MSEKTASPIDVLPKLSECQAMAENPKRRAILEAAGRLFLERGFNATSMDAIAEAAPVSKPTLYSHFKDKGDLFGAVIGGRCCSMVHTMVAHTSAEHESVEAALRAIANSFFDLIYAADSISLYRIIISELKQFPNLGVTLYDQGAVKILDILSSYLDQQNAKGTLRVADTEMGARLFFSMLKGDHHMQCLLGLRDVLSAEERAHLIDSAVGLFVTGYCNCTKS